MEIIEIVSVITLMVTIVVIYLVYFYMGLRFVVKFPKHPNNEIRVPKGKTLELVIECINNYKETWVRVNNLKIFYHMFPPSITLVSIRDSKNVPIFTTERFTLFLSPKSREIIVVEYDIGSEARPLTIECYIEVETSVGVYFQKYSISFD